MTTDSGSALRHEADFFSRQDNAVTRSVSWNAIPVLGRLIKERSDPVAVARSLLAGRPALRGLSLACGDMRGEYRLLRALGATAIDAYDISEGQRDAFFAETYDGAIPVDYRIADVTRLELPRARYDVVYMQHSLHHIDPVRELVANIRATLKPDGLFVLIDYIGPQFLQRSPRQLQVANRFFARLPERLRTTRAGVVWHELRSPRRDSMSPCEAINSSAILPALRDDFTFELEHVFAGLLFPLFNGFAQNYGEEDNLFVTAMWELDAMLVEQQLIEPNFIRAVMRPKL